MKNEVPERVRVQLLGSGCASCPVLSAAAPYDSVGKTAKKRCVCPVIGRDAFGQRPYDHGRA